MRKRLVAEFVPLQGAVYQRFEPARQDTLQ